MLEDLGLVKLFVHTNLLGMVLKLGADAGQSLQQTELYLAMDIKTMQEVIV